MRPGSIRIGSWVLLLPITVTLVVFFVVPLLAEFSISLRPFNAQTFVGEGFTLANFQRFLADPYYLGSFWRTLWMSLATTAGSVVVAYPIAYHLNGTAGRRLRQTLTLIVLTPLMLSLVVSAFAWIIILGSSGVLASLLSPIFPGARAGFLNRNWAEISVVAVMVYAFAPYAVLNIHAALSRVDPSLVRASLVHGASPRATFWRVVFPLSLPGVLAGILIVFALAMSAFIFPLFIGGGRVDVVPLHIYKFAAQLFDWPGGAALGVLLLILTLAVVFVVSRVVERRVLGWLHVAR